MTDFGERAETFGIHCGLFDLGAGQKHRKGTMRCMMPCQPPYQACYSKARAIDIEPVAELLIF